LILDFEECGLDRLGGRSRAAAGVVGAEQAAAEQAAEGEAAAVLGFGDLRRLAFHADVDDLIGL
jgi:hypothetical protein